MNGPQHYAAAEEILETIASWEQGTDEARIAAASMAQAHATLALAAATVDAAFAPAASWTDTAGTGWTGAEIPSVWREVLE